jgi:hypothetical protein
MVAPYTRSYYASNPPTMLAGRFGGGFAGAVQLGGVALAGSFDGFFVPTWMQAMSVGTWGQIAGTANPGAGLNMNAFCDMTLRPSDATVLAVASGGHFDGSSNGAASIRLTDNAPSWMVRRASSWNGVETNVLYYADGSPASRHTYHHTHYIAGLDAVLLAGCRFGWGPGTPTGPGMDLFSLSTNDYLPRFTYPDITPWGGAGYGIVQDGQGHIWTQAGHRFNVSTLTWSKPGSGSLLRYPAAYDSIRDRIFAMQFNDGEGFGGAGFQARELNPSTGNSVTITINSSAAFTQFVADAPAYAGMAFCPLDGKFYFLHPGRMGTFYVVTPNGTTTWDMATFTPGGTAPVSSGLLCKRLLWVDALQGFVLQNNANQNLRFLRMA